MRILSNFAAIAIVLLAASFSIAQVPAPLFEWTFDDADTVPNSSFAFSSASETLPNCVTAVDRSDSVSVELSLTDDAVATLDTSAWEVEPACFTVANWGFGFGHDMNAGAPQSFISDDLSQFELSFDARVAGTEDLRSTVRVQFLEFNDEGEEPTVWAELLTREADGATDFRPLITSDQQTFTTTLDQLDFADGFMLENLTENLTRISGVNFEFDVEGRSGEGSFDTEAIIGLDNDNEFILDNIQLVAPFDELPTLTIENFVINNNGGTAAATDWVLGVTDGADFTLVDVQGGDDVTNINVPIGTYAITATGGPDGYGQSGFGCSGSADTDFTDGIDLASGENVVCTFAHDDISPSLTLLKEVVNDSGGTATDASWTLTATGPTSVSGAEELPE